MASNLAAMRVLHTLDTAERPATSDEQAVLARWSGWGAVPGVFDPARDDLAEARARLTALLTPAQYTAARRSTLNAHYTDAGIVAAVWEGVAALGFTGGDVLEPGCGSGNFIGLAPSSARIVGIEVEPTTAAIAAALYPDAQIRAESFADTRAPEQSFDLTIGNVPFAKVALTDRRHNPSGHSIHNHFLIKSLHLTRPGGLVVALTSRYTLDSRNPAARREMAELADLVGAVRLPSGAHQRAAGTQVVTDLLILRRREPGRAGNGETWERVAPLRLAAAATPDTGGSRAGGDDGGGEVEVNRWFHGHPEHILGTAILGRGAYRAQDLMVVSAEPPAQTLPAVLHRIAAAARTDGLLLSPTDTTAAALPRAAALVSGRSDQREGYLQAEPDGGFTRVVSGALTPYPVPRSQVVELRALLGLRDTVVALLEAEASTVEDTDQIGALRTQLGQRYRDYVAAHGPIKRCTWRRTGRTDPDTGEDKLARIQPPQGGFRLDPFSPIVRALENYDDATATATTSAVFTRRVVAPRVPRLGADTPADALAICMDTYGEVRLPEIARLLGTDETAARDALGELVFDEPPATGATPRPAQDRADPVAAERLVPAAEYLSGNVRLKLVAARAAAAEDPRFEPNVAALTPALPVDLLPGEIHARLGAPWIGASYVAQFLRETLDDPSVRVEHPGGSIWAVQGTSVGVAATSTWGTTRRPAPVLAQAALEQRVVTVYDELDDGTRVPNLTETLAAQDKARELDARFAEWVWEDPARSDALARVYNDTFNAVVLRHYDGAELSLPGVALTFTPRAHQVAAVARMIGEPAVGLFHEVGAGKTAEMVMGIMELRRLGLVRKAAIVVPNHMLEQFSTEFLAIYPRATILPAGRGDLAGDRRRDFVARVATGDWDAVLLTRSAFERLPMSPTHQQAYLDQEAGRLREWIEKARAGGEGRSLTIKRMEATLARAEERLKATLGGDKDPGLTFEMTGIDYLSVDEAHDYKNLKTVSNIPNVGIEGSQRAADLDMKLGYLRDTHGGRVATLATATPIANSVAEAYTMQRYLRPDLLDAAGLTDFDTWAATFGEVVTGIELSPDGGRVRMQSRFARFKNVPELLRMWHVSAEVKTAQDLQLPTPLLAARSDGQRLPETVVIAPSGALRELVTQLGERADTVRSRGVDPTVDNMLKISGDGRAAALDLRLVGSGTDETTKLDVAANRIATIWRAHRDTRYPARGGGAHPVPGGLQLVFSDLGTPHQERWDVYHALRDLLHDRGLPGGSVRFIHEARNDIEKGALFAAAVEGQVAVLIGSTPRMGVGTNVQARAVALHHLDCPWRPADIAQREGRILRPGNHNPEVQVLRYVTEASFDAYSWQTVTRKAGFIAQIMRGRLDLREIEDVGDAALSYDEVKALATGDPRILAKAHADAELTRLERLQRAHHRSRDHLTRAVHTAAAAVAALRGDAAAVTAAIAARVDTRGDRFRAVTGTTLHTSRVDAGQALQALLQPALDRLDPHTRPTPTRPVAQLGGFTVHAQLYTSADRAMVELTLPAVPRAAVTLDRDQLRDADPAGLIARLENKLTGLERHGAQLAAEITAHQQETAKALTQQGKPFPHTAQLAAARDTVTQLTHEMTQRAAARNTDTAPDGHAGDSPAVTAPAAALASDRAATAGRGGDPAPPGDLGETIRAWRRDRDTHAHEVDQVTRRGEHTGSDTHHSARQKPGTGQKLN